MNPPLNVFLSGIIQGSHLETIHEQDYRREIGDLIKKHLPDAVIYDPFEHHPDSMSYDPETGRDVFFELMDHAGEADILIAFVPEASMGTAVEMWNAFHTGAVVIAVSPLTTNWTVRYLADTMVPDIEGLKQFLKDGGLETLLEQKIGYEHE